MGRKGMKAFLKGVSHANAQEDDDDALVKQPAASTTELPASSIQPRTDAATTATTASSLPTAEDDGDDRQETKGQMIQRHKREMLAHKKAMSKLGKAKKDEIAKMTAELEARHAAELAATDKPNPELQVDEGSDDDVASTANQLQNASISEARAKKPSKGQKRREKRAQEEAEREARIAEERAAAGPSAGQLEEARLAALLAPQQLKIREIRADGHCLYRSVEDQLRQADPASTPPDYLHLRRLAAAHMRQHPDDYLPFLAAEDEGGDADGEGDLGARLEEHCRKLEETAEWGGQMELRALAAALQRHIRVYAVGMPAVEMGEEHSSRGTLQVCYLRHAFGLGEHYNSVEPAGKGAGEEEDEEDGDEE